MNNQPGSLARRRLGRTGLDVSTVCIGTAAWGVTAPHHEMVVPEADAIATVQAAFDTSVNFLDTSNNYGDGESERRIGRALAEVSVPDDFVIQTKLDRDPVTDSFSKDRLERSLEESLTRLGVSKVPILFLHDPENTTFEAAMAAGGAVDTLCAMRDAGYARFIGISGGPARLLRRFVDTGVFDIVQTHNRFTLVDRSAEELIAAASAAGIGVINAAVYGGGLLARWPRTTSRYHYREAPAPVLAAVDAMGRACESYGVSLRAAALQCSTRDERIGSTVCGVTNPTELSDTLVQLNVEIPDELWLELDSLRPPPSEWIND